MGDAAGDDEQIAADRIAMRRWVRAVCVLDFDVSTGPVVEMQYPPDALADEQTTSLCRMAFPDGPTDADAREGGARPVYCQRLCRPQSLFVTVLFHQERDSGHERGAIQKVLAICSHLPLPELFAPVVRILGDIYFEHPGRPVLEAAARQWSQWGDPDFRKAHQLPFLGTVVDLPANCVQDCNGLPMGMFCGYSRWSRDLGAAVADLWAIWESVLVGQPVLVIGESPQQVSNAVLAVLSVIGPHLAYHADYRPYMTISDPDCQHYQTMCSRRTLPPCVLGVTNLLFNEALADFPNVLRLAKPNASFSASQSHVMTPDRPFLRALAGAAHAEAMLRAEFSALTSTFLSAFSRMFKPVPHLQRVSRSGCSAGGPAEFNPYLDAPRLPADVRDDLIDHLDIDASKGRLRLTRRQARTLYKHFMAGPNFLPWYTRARLLAQMELDGRTDAAIIAADSNLGSMADGLTLGELNAILKEIDRRLQCPRSLSRPALLSALQTHRASMAQRAASLGSVMYTSGS